MKKILHRVNTINYLKKVPKEFGVEVDIRSFNNKVIISHEPLLNGTEFEDWISFFEHDFLILNIKEEGLEKYVLDILEKYKIKNFFFLDQSFPFLLKTINSGEKRCAIRISEFESMDKMYLTIAFGCTGGRHRSVYFAESMARSFQKPDVKALVNHRDI